MSTHAPPIAVDLRRARQRTHGRCKRYIYVNEITDSELEVGDCRAEVGLRTHDVTDRNVVVNVIVNVVVAVDDRLTCTELQPAPRQQRQGKSNSRGLHRDGISVPSPPVPAPFTSIPPVSVPVSFRPPLPILVDVVFSHCPVCRSLEHCWQHVS